MVSAREIVGKRIVAFRPNPAPRGDGRTIHSPEIELDDGSALVFVTEEHPQGDYYGVWIGRRLPPLSAPALSTDLYTRHDHLCRCPNCRPQPPDDLPLDQDPTAADWIAE